MIRLGDQIIDAGQRYACVELIPHVRQDGTPTTLAVMSASCATCGRAFATTVPAATRAPRLNRRCQTHKRPGIRTTKGRTAHAKPN